MIQSPKTTGAGSCPWIVATLISVIVEDDGIRLVPRIGGIIRSATIEGVGCVVNRLIACVKRLTLPHLVHRIRAQPHPAQILMNGTSHPISCPDSRDC